MKLIRHGAIGKEKPGILVEGVRRDCSHLFRDWDHEFFSRGVWEQLAASEELSPGQQHLLPEIPQSVRWGAPVVRPGKVICIGLNYSDHAAEAGMPTPSEPIVFMKAANAVVGPYDKVCIPRLSGKTDWEVELGVVIGTEARYLASPEDSLAHVAGICICNDVSEREFQLERGGQWVKGKSCDTFNPMGPFLLTTEEWEAGKELAMQLSVNGEVMQKGVTSRMIFNVPYIIYYLSQFMTLEPGDLINTGTPPGVGMGQSPPRYLKSGDTMELSIEGLGIQKQAVVTA
ncbi:fumarylacetoacetate hydrolase family protein [Calycomorphotria hydatis]|uniref:Ureidoglycolate lyase n=1 Tax=Calycomorphotria hydatis TaxID=2528027 RepID=A0A517TA33_9PLAN|nr:fumarylacetoacetate hydrolase family protein [Calycomorphotria hydatis]QDT65238.1 Ureidoglycolate lyase [Calycomorphotria hydatis]